MEKINYKSSEDCLHCTYEDMKNMTTEDAIFILDEIVNKYHSSDENHRVNLPRSRLIRAYEIAIEYMKNNIPD